MVFIECFGISQRVFAEPVSCFLVIHISISLSFIGKKILSGSKLALFTVAVGISPGCLKFQTAQYFPFQESRALEIIAVFIHDLVIDQSYRIVHLRPVLQRTAKAAVFLVDRDQRTESESGECDASAIGTVHLVDARVGRR